MKPVELFLHWNQQVTSCPSPQRLIEYIPAQKPILVVATDQVPIIIIECNITDNIIKVINA